MTIQSPQPPSEEEEDDEALPQLLILYATQKGVSKSFAHTLEGKINPGEFRTVVENLSTFDPELLANGDGQGNNETTYLVFVARYPLNPYVTRRSNNNDSVTIQYLYRR